MLSFLQPILSYSQGGGRRNLYLRARQTTAEHLQPLAGQHWQELETQGARHHLHLAAHTASYGALGI